MPVRLTVVNRSDAARTVRAEPAALGNVPAAPAAFGAVRVGPRATATMTGSWTAGTGLGQSVGAVRVAAAGPPEDAFFIFLEGDVIQQYATAPPAVDFGKVVAGHPRLARTARVQWAGAPAGVESVTVEPPDPRLSVTPVGAERWSCASTRAAPARSAAWRGSGWPRPRATCSRSQCTGRSRPRSRSGGRGS